MELPTELDLAFRRVLDGVPAGRLAPAVDRLIAGYRDPDAPAPPRLETREDAAAYAAYRMPATYAAVRSALGRFASAAGAWEPGSHLDVGGGTGAAAWAVADLWPRLGAATVVDRSAVALALGRELAAGSAVLSGARWQGRSLGAGCELPPASLVTVCYLLGELAPADGERLVDEAAARGEVVAVVEPGTPAGYLRVRAARSRLIEAGMSVVAPCPHQSTCPVTPGEDWCHFAVRLPRSPLHRRLKQASLGYEDEKFSYVIASRSPHPTAPSRVVRHPRLRKNLVTLRLCTADPSLTETNVTRGRDGELYRAARKAGWGDGWPPAG